VAAHVKQREDVQTAFRAHGALPQHVGFACVLNLPIGLHRIWIELRTPDGHWVAVRRASLLRLPAIGVRRPGAAHKSLASYLRARRKFEQAELPEIQRHIRVMLVRPHFTVLIDCPRFDASLKRTLASLRQQVYPHFDIRVRSMRASASLPAWVAPGTLLSGLGLPSDAGDFVMFINSGDELHERTLYEFADAINKNAHADLIYADELHLRPRGGPPLPFYKPEWSPDYLETFNYIGFTACFRSALVRECTGPGGPMGRYDMTLRITEHSQHIIHLPKLLGQARTMNAVDDAGASDDIAALSARLERTGRAGTVRQHAVQKGCYDIELKLRRQPLVSIVIPTAGKTITLDGRQIDLLANVIEQIASRSTYPNFELVIVDNDDLSPSQLEILSRHACKRATYRERQFNIAKKLNLGVTVATGDLLLLMNDDIEILTPNWIERMVEHFEKPHVGVVGGKLLYPDSRTQHVGVVHNSGNPDHVRRLYPRDDAGYFFSTCGVRNFGAVTGACMMTRASVYRRVGGYSEALAVSYNDADYCLKVAECGLYTVYAPAVELTHMESQSRVASADPEEVIWYHARWASTVISDRFYNERFLSVASPTFVPVINERLV
jgi:GT2 family glycosyltransferase